MRGTPLGLIPSAPRPALAILRATTRFSPRFIRAWPPAAEASLSPLQEENRPSLSFQALHPPARQGQCSLLSHGGRAGQGAGFALGHGWAC